MAFSFDHVRIGLPTGDRSQYQDWTLTEFKKIMTGWQNGLQDAGAWHALYLENHDQVSWNRWEVLIWDDLAKKCLPIHQRRCRMA